MAVWTDGSPSSPAAAAASAASTPCCSPPKAPRSSSTTSAAPATAAAPTPRPPRRSSTRSSPPAARRWPTPTASPPSRGPKEMVAQAVEAFGDLHVIVNNAGILRDRMLVSMSEEDFDDVIAVHLKGTFNLTRHAAELLARAGQGRRRGRPGDRQHVVGRRPARQRRADQLRRRQGRHRGDDDRQRRRAEALPRAGELHRPDRPHPPHPGHAGDRRGDGQAAVRPGAGRRRSSPTWRPPTARSPARCSACTATASASTRGGRSPRTSTPATSPAVAELAVAMDKLPRQVKVRNQNEMLFGGK